MARLREVAFADFARRLRVRERRIPVQGMIETTFRCNLSCAHCYVNKKASDVAAQARELSFERLSALIDEIVDAGCLSLVLTGGEPLIRPDFPALYVHAIQRGLMVTVFTNGTLISEALADLFNDHRPETVEITLYGMTPETYERVTRIPGSHALCMAGIRRLVDRDVRVRLKAMALQWNQHEIPAMRDLARRLGLPFRHDAFLNPRIDGATSLASELQLGPDDVVALDMTDAKSAEDLRRFCDKSISPGENVPPKESVFLCGAGEASFAVDPGGRLLPCLLLRKICFDLKPGDFERSWNELGACLESHAWTRPSPCRSCNLMALCASCAGAAELETGDLEGIVRQFCVITHHRAAAFLGASCGHRQDASCCLGQDDSAERADLMSSNRSMKAG